MLLNVYEECFEYINLNKTDDEKYNNFFLTFNINIRNVNII